MASNDTSPAQPTVAQQTQIQAPAGQLAVAQQGQVPPGQPSQPVVYQMAPGQPQPVFVQVPPGQPTTTPEGQPIQYYYVPIAQPVQPGQPGYPMQPGQPGYPVQPGQPGYPVQPGQPGYPVHLGKPVQGYPAPGQLVYPVQPQQQPGSGMSLSIDSNFLKSPLCYVKIGEFITLLAAWASLLRYLDAFPDLYYDEKSDFFKGVTIFCWVMVIGFLVMYAFSVHKVCGCNNRPSTWTLTIFITYFVLASLLLACSGNLVPRAVYRGKYFDALPDDTKTYVVGLFVALAFGFLSWVLFVVDMYLTYKKFQEQRAQEAPPDQGPGQPRAWDIDSEFLSSAAFKVKITEIVTLFVAWASILKYSELYRILGATDSPSVEDSKANFFKGITIFAWVVVIVLLLTFVFSLGRLCQRRSHWTLTAIIIYLVLSVLLIACSGNLVPRAIEFGKDYERFSDKFKPNIMALFIGLGFGIISWILFIADMSLLYKLHHLQKAQELNAPQAVPGQQPGVVVVAQVPGQQSMAHAGQPPIVYPAGQQPVKDPGQQPTMYPGQQVVIGPGQQGFQHAGPPPSYDQK